uniref:Membrane bound O-acyltransferase domain containing 2b n=1 Tax=Eptatretus burgeri TaxID=7764 RepID=A0A8C4WXG3_EPTBU
MAAAQTGSVFLQPLSVLIDLPVDQVNFVVCLGVALCAGPWFRLYLHPSHASPNIRHIVATILGFYLAIFCFGWYTLHFVAYVSVSFALLHLVSAKHVHRYSFVVAIGYLSLCQMWVYISDYGVYSTDFTGPMMVMAQKITSLAFEVHDGLGRKNEELSEDQQRLAVRQRPNLLQYLSYNFNFLSILAGPCCSYKDYVAFIEGWSCTAWANPQGQSDSKPNGYKVWAEPSPTGAAFLKLAVAVASLGLHLTLGRAFPVLYNVDERFVRTGSFHARLCYLVVSVQAARPKYYFAWSLADAIHNAAGFGFNGYTKSGQPRWDLVSNINIWNIETATSFKMFLDNWNTQTVRWLKFVCYDRLDKHTTVATFMLSAAWHGVYPGYYFTFFTGILMSLSARVVRTLLKLVLKTLKFGFVIMVECLSLWHVNLTPPP